MTNRKRVYGVVCLVILVFSLHSCKGTLTKDEISKKISVAVSEYAEKEYGKANVDSIVVSNVDTLTKLGYAKMVLEMLENMNDEYQVIYQEALDKKDLQALPNIENTIDQINATTEFYRQKVNSDSIENTGLLLYIVQAVIYKKDKERIEVIYFLTPDLQIHVLDPFSDHFLE